MSWKFIEPVLLQMHKENKDVIDHNQHGITKGKLCLASLMAFYGRVT